MTLRGLLLDFGGVVTRSAFEGLADLERHLGLQPGSLPWRGPFDLAGDEPWRDVEAGRLHERDYWARRAREVGALLGVSWETTDFYAAVTAAEPAASRIRPEADALVDDARAAGLATGILANDLELFHGRPWMESIEILRRVDVFIDCSYLDVAKPQPKAYLLAVEALGLRPAEVLFVDNQPPYVEGAREAGLPAIRLDITRPAEAFEEARRRLGLPLR